VEFSSPVKNAVHRASIPLRRRHYSHGGGRRWTGRVPAAVRHKLGLDDAGAVGSRRIEIGCGPFPTPGYIHVDVDPAARHLEAFTPGWKLPFPAGWADEVLAVHSLEHVPPSMLMPTLREWHRVLAAGGRVRVHVPNTLELTQSFLESPVEQKWRTMGAMLGMFCHPGVRSPEELEVAADHQLMFDKPLLSWALETAGFVEVTDLTERLTDRHSESWSEVVPHFSLIFEAHKA
jgi:predicted SAM-dependent methyltransferase